MDKKRTRGCNRGQARMGLCSSVLDYLNLTTPDEISQHEITRKIELLRQVEYHAGYLARTHPFKSVQLKHYQIEITCRLRIAELRQSQAVTP